jgi:phospholipase/carboxylesterase
VTPVVAWRRPTKSGPATPLVVLLHGRGADEYDLLDIANFLPRAYTYASVRAPVPVEGGGYTWFENRGVARPIPRSIASSTAAFRAWLDDPAIGCATQTCYLVGFSAGMMMAAALALDDPSRFAGAVLLSGAIAFYGRGTLDDVIPHDLVSQTDAYLRGRSGASLTFREYPHGHSISRAELEDIATWFDG